MLNPYTVKTKTAACYLGVVCVLVPCVREQGGGEGEWEMNEWGTQGGGAETGGGGVGRGWEWGGVIEND